MSQPVFEITKSATFDAAHYLPEGPDHQPYRNMHGHSFKVEATVRGEAAQTEFDTVKARVAELDQGEVGLDEARAWVAAARV